MIFDSFQRLQHALYETQRRQATSNRMATVHEVKQEGGEQKIRAVIGVDPNGKELLSPWLNTTEGRSGAASEQFQYKKGQNVRLSGDDYRQATVTHASEATGESGDGHAPQPKNAAEHGYGNSYQVGGKLFGGYWGPEEEEQQQGGQGGQGGGGGGGGGGGSGGQEKNHRHETWIAKEDHAPSKYSGKSEKVSQGASGGGGGQQSGQQQQKSGAGGQKKLEEAVMVSTDEKNGFTARVGKDVRVAAHEQGAKTKAGKTYYSAKKDDDSILNSEKDHYLHAKKNFWYMAEDTPYINKPWVIKEKKKDDEIPDDNQLGNKKSKSA